MAKVKFTFWILMLGFIISLAGCCQKDSAYQTEELLMWLVGSESQAKVIQAIGDNFFKDQGISFRCEAISWGDAHTKYLTSIAGGVIPDIGTMGLTWGTEFGNLGAMIDLAKEFPEDVGDMEERTFAGLWNAIHYKDSVYGIPFDISLQIMFYRNDILESPPGSWEELVDVLKYLKSQGNGMIFDWGSMSWIGYASYLWQAGGDFYNPEGTASILNSDEAVKALEFFSSLYTELGVPKTRITLEQGMRTGDFPLAISGNWNVDSLRLSAPEIMGKWSLAPLPAGPSGKRTAFLGGRILGIFSASKNKQKSWEFIKFLFRPATQALLYEAAREAQDSYLPPNKLAWDMLDMELEFKKVLKLQALDAKGPPSVLGWDESTRFIEEAIQKVVLQGADAKDELANTAERLTGNIKE